MSLSSSGVAVVRTKEGCCMQGSGGSAGSRSSVMFRAFISARCADAEFTFNVHHALLPFMVQDSKIGI